MNVKYLLIVVLFMALTGCSSTTTDAISDVEISFPKESRISSSERSNEMLSEIEKDFIWLANLEEGEQFFSVEKADGFLHFYSNVRSKDPLSLLGDGVAILRNLSASTGFAVNSTTLNTTIKGHLDSIASAYLARTQTRGKQLLVVTGHTDSSGEWAYNIDLSLRRALSAARYLAAQGIPNDAIVLIAGGPDYPVAKNISKKNKARNRRVEILITEDEQFATNLYRNYHCAGQACETRSMEVWAFSREKKLSSDLRHLDSLRALREELELIPETRNGVQLRRRFRKAPYSTYIYRKFDITKYINK